MADLPLVAGVFCFFVAVVAATTAVAARVESGVDGSLAAFSPVSAATSASNTESDPCSEYTSLGAIFFRFFFFGLDSHVTFLFDFAFFDLSFFERFSPSPVFAASLAVV